MGASLLTFRGVRSRRGIALVIVSWLAIILALWSVLFLREAMVAGASSGHAVSKLRCRLGCESAIATAFAFLADRDNNLSGPGELQPWADNDAEFANIEVGGDVRAALVSFDLARGEAGELRYGLVDEASKLHLRMVTEDMLAKLPGMTAEIAAAIIDWRDENDEPLEEGAEGETYEQLPAHPYAAKNADFETLGELLLVKGVDPDVLFGEDKNLNGRLDANEDTDEDGLLRQGLFQYLTLYSYAPNVNRFGEPRIDLNTASQQELREALGDRLSNQQIQTLIAARTGSPLISIGQIASIPRFSSEVLKTIMDDVTVHSAEWVVGRVNAVTAPREVLAALPGMDEELADGLIAAREGVADGLDTLGWVLDVLGVQRFAVLANWLTVRGYQFRVQAQSWIEPGAAEGSPTGAAGFGEAGDERALPAGRAYARILYVICVAETTPRILYRRDLGRFGPLRMPAR